jgi:hypothetical protein
MDGGYLFTKCCSQSSYESHVIENHEIAPLTGGGHFTAAGCKWWMMDRLDHWTCIRTYVWYIGTDVDVTATPNPEIMRPIIIMENALDPDAPASNADPKQTTSIPISAAYLLPKRSLTGWLRKM